MRDSEEILVWLLRSGIKQADVARALRIRNVSVSQWIHNRITSRRIAAWFRKAGCPEEFLDIDARRRV